MNLLFDNFPILSGAPNGVKKLRELILQSAVMGKLVDQDPRDEPASILLDKIRAEKERLIKEEKIKKPKPLPPITESEIHYPLPTGWEFIKIGDALELINGKAFKPSDWTNNGLPIIRIQNLNNVNATYNYCNKEIEERYHIYNEDFLISWSGTPGTSFGAFIWRRGHAVLNQHIFKCILIGNAFLKEYLRYAVNSRLDEMISKAHGGAGLQHITKGKLENMLISLPPVGEQRRIVAKVDRLMELCDRLEEQEEKSRKKQVGMNNASLHKLLSASEPQEFEENRRRIAENFHLLYDIPENVSGLKQAILQLAVMGKLVPQDPRDEPASILLDKIKTEKEQLIKEGKIKKPKPLPPITESETPYQLPTGWEWAWLGDVTNYGLTDKVEKKDVNNNTWVLELEDIIKISSKLIRKVRFHERKFKSTKNVFYKGDVIYGKLRPYLDKVIVADEDGVCTTEMIPISGYNNLYSFYLKWLLKSPFFVTYANNSTHGMNLPRLGTEKARLAKIPIPPVGEQRRIVAKVDRLMELCNSLEEYLKKGESKSEKLFNAVLNRVFN